MSTTDVGLWERWKAARDPDAFAEIVSRHSSMVFSASKRVLGNAADAEEVVQECFLELLGLRARIHSSLA